MTRAFWVVLHRWAGLTMALFLVLLALTGSLLAFHDPLDALFAPDLYAVEYPAGTPMLDPVVLGAAAEARHGARIEELPLAVFPDRPLILWLESADGRAPLGFNQLFLDPVTGAELGRRTFGDIGAGWGNLMPFVYRMHDSLLLGQWGVWFLGVVALVWTLDCFVGFYLSLPQPGRGWWRRLGPIFRLKRPVRAGHRLHVDLHRAGGLWLWPVLLVFAWSSVGFTLWQVYNPVMALAGTASHWSRMPESTVSDASPAMPRAEAVAHGARLLDGMAARDGFEVERLTAIEDLGRSGAWALHARTSLDLTDDPALGATVLVFAADTGAAWFLVTPGGPGAGDWLSDWVFALHRAEVGRLPWRIAVCVLGLLVTGLAVTGILIWMRKRTARLLRRPERVAGPVGVPAGVLPSG